MPTGPFGYEHRGCSARPFSQHPTPPPIAASPCSTTTTRHLPDACITTVAAIRVRPGPRAPLAAPNPDPLLDSHNNIAKGPAVRRGRSIRRLCGVPITTAAAAAVHSCASRLDPLERVNASTRPLSTSGVASPTM
ncbi:hypothetical protein HYPSUDRAFT_209514 [Hypholoma sublateritium FD-334 SS-4]|uniref:Uncharacterized protein n=1 Tax=Hypholoma sublateritium (strain FD-334 SS-4) TaxID=945553 RepID=A0A0D2NYC5_HYPSF|nr:hypothetical protein HYPSUDRAFT_209514 [Hypholoma sublateritium FD-334 SS-4]